jgi:hypothetical protein
MPIAYTRHSIKRKLVYNLQGQKECLNHNRGALDLREVSPEMQQSIEEDFIHINRQSVV